MLLHIYFCDGCFIQMLKDSKNLLKMSLKILFIKRKREIPSIPPLPLIRPMAIFFPRPSTAASAPAHPFPLGPAAPAQPRASCRPSLAAPGNCRAQQLTPGPHLSAPSPTPRGSATARSWRCSNRRHDARRGRVLPLPSASLKGSRALPRAPPAAPAPFSPRPGRNCRTEEPRRPPISPSASPSSPSRHRLRFSPVVSSPWSPLPPHVFRFAFRGF